MFTSNDYCIALNLQNIPFFFYLKFLHMQYKHYFDIIVLFVNSRQYKSHYFTLTLIKTINSLLLLLCHYFTLNSISNWLFSSFSWWYLFFQFPWQHIFIVFHNLLQYNILYTYYHVGSALISLIIIILFFWNPFSSI